LKKNFFKKITDCLWIYQFIVDTFNCTKYLLGGISYTFDFANFSRIWIGSYLGSYW